MKQSHFSKIREFSKYFERIKKLEKFISLSWMNLAKKFYRKFFSMTQLEIEKKAGFNLDHIVSRLIKVQILKLKASLDSLKDNSEE